MRALIAIALAACWVSAASAALQPPAPTPAKTASQPERQAGQEQKQAEYDKRGTKALPLVIEISQSPVVKAETTDKTEKRHDYASSEWWLVYLTGSLVAVTFGLAVYTGKLYRATVTLGQEAKASGETQNANTSKALKISEEHANYIAASERGYVKLSEIEPGVQPVDGKNFCVIQFEVKNFGKTPAHVTDVRIESKALEFGERLPDPFPFGPHSEAFPNGFLMPGESLTVITSVSRASVDDGSKQLWFFGRVDYIDAFGKRWRGGYARKYVDRKDGNLRRDFERRTDFDRPRNPNEGDDWDKNAPA